MAFEQGNRGAGGGANASTHTFCKQGVGIVVGGMTGYKVEVLLTVDVEFRRMGSKEPPSEEVGEGTTKLTDGHKGHGFPMLPMVGSFWLYVAKFLGPHKCDGGIVRRAIRDCRQ